jgi:hypothetical protein
MLKTSSTRRALCALLLLVGPWPLRAEQGPLAAIHGHVCGLHFYNGQMDRQVLAHHFCAHVTEDLMQCVIYDSGQRNARLIGIEYVISERLFKTLAPEEKKLWHSHAFEVQSGLLGAPGLSEAAEATMMRDFVSTYGKTWHTWQVDRGDPVPLGIPQLMMAFTAEGQVKPGLVQERDKAVGRTAAELKRKRAGLPTPAVDPAADAWRREAPLQLELRPKGAPPVIRIPMH